MKKYKNNDALKQVGLLFKSKREALNLDIEDIVEMTGFTYKKIFDFEKGEETSLSYFIQLSFAINLHPKELLDLPLIIETRYKHSNTRIEKVRLTARIKSYIEQDYFKTPRRTSDIILKLKDDFKVSVESKNLSAILGRFVKSNILRVIKDGARNLYHS